MNFQKHTETICAMLNVVASRGFMSEPVPYSWSQDGATHQVVEFTAEEKAQLRAYLLRAYFAMYHSVLSKTDYAQESFFGSGSTRSASLLNMLQWMLSSSDNEPEYVSANAARLQKALVEYTEEFKSVDFAHEMQTMMAGE